MLFNNYISMIGNFGELSAFLFIWALFDKIQYKVNWRWKINGDRTRKKIKNNGMISEKL